MDYSASNPWAASSPVSDGWSRSSSFGSSPFGPCMFQAPCAATTSPLLRFQPASKSTSSRDSKKLSASDGEDTTDRASASINESSATSTSSDDDEYRSRKNSDLSRPSQEDVFQFGFGDEFADASQNRKDLAPEEAKARGAELLSMLSDFGLSDSGEAKQSSKVAPPPAPQKTALRASCEPWEPPARATGAVSDMAVCLSSFATQSRCSAVVSAARRTFGIHFVRVSEPQNEGTEFVTVWLRKGVRAEPLIERFTQELWPLLDNDVLSLQPEALFGAGASEPIAQIQMWCLDISSESTKDLCRDFQRCGECHRGAACQFRHTLPATHGMDIQICVC
mmetsp:Transcript_11311/g.20422  ORF Transcript_11311/g.20422 Transcript_11311/m.20422 type:complete len:336 (+) Transcript_11311:152-1159(+)